MTSSRELKRLDGLARSPVFAMLSESMSGVATLRTNHAVDFSRKDLRSGTILIQGLSLHS